MTQPDLPTDPNEPTDAEQLAAADRPTDAQQPAAADWGAVTDPRIAAAVARLDRLAESPPVEHVAVYEEVHRVLQDSLADAARAPESATTGTDHTAIDPTETDPSETDSTATDPTETDPTETGPSPTTPADATPTQAEHAQAEHAQSPPDPSGGPRP